MGGISSNYGQTETSEKAEEHQHEETRYASYVKKECIHRHHAFIHTPMHAHTNARTHAHTNTHAHTLSWGGNGKRQMPRLAQTGNW